LPQHYWAKLGIKKGVTIGLPSMPQMQPVQAVSDIAHVPTFPFLKVHFSKTNKAQTYEVNVDVSPTLHNLLTQHFEEGAIIYLDLTSYPPLGVWGKHMNESIRLLSKIGLISTIVPWVAKARERIQMNITNQKPRPIGRSESSPNTAKTAERMLRAAGLLSEIDANPDLVRIAQDVLQSGKKDMDTTIYRVAMAVYHAGKYSGQPLLPTLEDPAKVYLTFTSDKSVTSDFKEITTAMTQKEPDVRHEFVRTFMCFLAGVYLCNKALLQK
jgi:hypothetical protein